MKRRSPLVLAAGVSSALIVLTSAMNYLGVTSVPLPFVAATEVHSLTGVEGVDGPVLVVKLDDTKFAHPQVGLRDADVVYIEQVEGGLTRLAAVFSSKIPEIVGPIRSARISDIELMAQYGKVAFAYSGAQSKLMPVINAANIHDSGAMKYGPSFYLDDAARRAPYAMMLKSRELFTKVNAERRDISISKPMGWVFGDAPEGLRSFESVHISWPASSYDAQWSPEESRWLLSHSGTPNFDNTGYQLGPKTLVIQMVSITDSIYKDKVGGVTPFTATVGSGRCYLLRDGGVKECLWERSDELGGTVFTDLIGNELSFDKGQIWFALASKEPLFKGLAAQGATPTPTK
ncbi:MAG: hypothetical protein RJA33_1286 [Actinomycetota bacterium]|jgi:hypothetical protein